jgi:hypothetical protein
MTSVPHGLLDEINRGNCVAFVGAGFSLAAGLPVWKELLRQLAETEGVDATLSDHVRGLAKRSDATAHDLDQAAQMLVDVLDARRFTKRLREILVKDSLPAAMEKRLGWLRGTPFKAILTTNFDGVLRGSEAEAARAYRRILRNERAFWWQESFWGHGSPGAPVLKLHGDLLAPLGEEGLVFTREDYRRKLYGDPSYITFLRSVLSTSTVLYLGFSFTDAYLNELRSEILALLGYGQRERPIAYAVLADVSAATQRHLLRHEGIEVLPYDSRDPANHGGFDRWIEAIHEATSPLSRLGEVLKGKRLLWVDPNPNFNAYGVEMLQRAALSCSRELDPVVKADAPRTAIEALLEARHAGRPFDLVITYWGQSRDGNASPGAALLSEMRARDIRCPVLVFAGDRDAERRKREALALGAQAYCFRFETLFRRIEDVFAPAIQTW